MRFLKYLCRLFRDLLGFAWENKIWWIVPLVAVLLILCGLVFVSQSAAPFIYTLF